MMFHRLFGNQPTKPAAHYQRLPTELQNVNTAVGEMELLEMEPLNDSQKDSLNTLITSENVFKGRQNGSEYVHIVFSEGTAEENQQNAAETADLLFKRKLISMTPGEKELRAPNVSLTDPKRQNYPADTYFVRVHKSAYPKIVAYLQDNHQATIPSFNKLGAYDPSKLHVVIKKTI